MLEPAIVYTFLIYLAGMLLIGVMAYRRTHNLSDYILGGRKLGPWVTALSASASDMSGWLLLGLPGFAFSKGMVALWMMLGLALGTYFNWRMIAKRLRLYSEIADNALTLPEFFSRRFNDEKNILRLITAMFTLLFFLFYTTSGLVAGGKLFTEVFNMPYHYAVITGGVAILIYTSFGGFFAVSWTDLFQSLLMMFALLLVPWFIIQTLGGWDGTKNQIEMHNPEILNPLTDIDGSTLPLVVIISTLAWGLGYFGQPHILARFKAIQNIHALTRARHIAMTWVILSMLGAVLVGISGIAYFDQPISDPEQIFIQLVQIIFHPVIAGICLAAILAAIMSTADSQLLVSASVLTEDFYKTLVRPAAGELELVWIGRVAVFSIACIAMSLAWDENTRVLDVVAYAWAGFGAAFGPTLILSLFWRRMNFWGALAGMLVGGGTVILWEHFASSALYEIVPGILASSLSIIIVSLSTKPPATNIVEIFDTVRTQAEQK